MRKCIFYLTLFSALFPCFGADFSYSLSNFYSDFKLTGLNARVAARIPETSAGDTPAWGLPAFGLSFTTAALSELPFIFKTGQLTASGISSKLSSPALSSTVSPLGGTAGSAASLSISLPSTPSDTKPYGISAAFDYSNLQGFIKKLNLTNYISTESTIQAFNITLNPAKKIETAFSLAAGTFTTENSCSSWFSETELFPPYVQTPVAAQFSLLLPHFKSKETACFFQNIHKKNYYTFSTENSLVTPYFVLNLAAFSASSPEIFTSSSSQLKTLCQFKVNPQVTVYSSGNTFRLRFGTAFLAEEKLLSLYETTVTKKISNGLQLRTKLTTSSLSFLINDFETYTGTLNCSVYCSLRPSASAQYSYSEDSQTGTLNLSAKICPGKRLRSVTAKYSVTTKNKEISSQNITIASGFKLNKKSLTVCGTAGIDFEF